jgi:hypothetical protein
MNRFRKFFSRQKAQFEDRNKIKIYSKEEKNSVYTINPEDNPTVQIFLESRGLEKQWLFLQIMCNPNKLKMGSRSLA